MLFKIKLNKVKISQVNIAIKVILFLSTADFAIAKSLTYNIAIRKCGINGRDWIFCSFQNDFFKHTKLLMLE